MKIGLVFDAQPPEVGGGFTFQESLLDAITGIASHHEILCFSYGGRKSLTDHSLRWIQLVKSPGKEAGQPLNDAVLQHQIEMVWYVTMPSYETVHVPYIFPVWDLEHRSQPYFPEVSVSGWMWAQREQFYKYVLPRAAYVLTGTQAGKHDVIRFYNIPEERVIVVPMPTSGFCLHSEPSSGQSAIPSNLKYLFYPAQFWPHKNHVSILYALKILRERGQLDFSVVFTGSDKGNLRHVQEVTRNLGLNDHVYFRGFVDRDELVQLYKNAFALVYPSFFGPDNLPPLEAFALGCPVIAAQVSGAEEQFGDAALLFDPKDEEQLVTKITLLHANNDLRATLIQRGLSQARKWTAKDYVSKVYGIIDGFLAIRRCWSSLEPFRHL